MVEDHSDSREALSRILRKRGHTILSAGTAEEALLAIPSSRCDLLLCDIGLPGMDGWTLLKRLSLVPLARPLYAVAMTAFTTARDRAKSCAAGFRQHICKPFNLIEILEAVKVAGRLAPA